MYDLTCLGHLTHDKIVTPGNTVHMAGGTSFYFSHAVKSLPIKYQLITALSTADSAFATSLSNEGIEVTILPSTHTVYFENKYSHNSDEREQKVLHEADPFQIKDLENIKSKYIHLGPLLANDMSTELIRMLATKAQLSLDVQGFLRGVHNQQVHPIDWVDKATVLPLITILKASESEAFTLTGEEKLDHAAKKLFDMGVKEVVITMGSKGSIIYDGSKFITIPAYKPIAVIDATGCGDTYMAGYLYQRLNGSDTFYAGAFGAAMATIKIAATGPFNDTEAAIEKIIKANNVL